MIVYRIAVYLFNNEFENCWKFTKISYPICEEKSNDTKQENPEAINKSVALFKNNILRLKALACENLFNKRQDQSDWLIDAIVAAYEASDSMTQA